MFEVGNQQQHDPEVQERISRLLTHLGHVLQELGGLMPAQLSAPQKADPDINDIEETPVAARQDVEPTPAPEKAEVEVSHTESHETINQVLDDSFAALFGLDGSDEAGSDSENGSEAPDQLEPDQDRDTGPEPELEAPFITPDITIEADDDPAPPVKPQASVTKLSDNATHPLYLVWEDHRDRRLAAPWNWVTGTHLTAGHVPEAFTLNDGHREVMMNVSRVRGIWTVRELEDWQEPVHWIRNLDDELDAPLKLHVAPAESPEGLESATPPAPAASIPVAPATTGEPVPATDAVTDEDTSSYLSKRVWIVSPSALARRFLMRHLDEMGLEVHEARDLDDPLLPADLNSAGALFLDESLRKHWGNHAASTLTDLPLVLLTVDGMLNVPSNGKTTELKAMLPRPFERSEVESVVAWLRSHWMGSGTGRSDHHGEEDDDTWLFADPFGTTGSGNNPGS
jgi:hypothetical protein